MRPESEAEDEGSPISRQVSLSFFAPIDPLLPRRQAELHTLPQYIFPSRFNNHLSLAGKDATRREVPYAVSSMGAAYYWTREDCLDGVRWDLFAKVPCANCAVKGHDLAARCDVRERRGAACGRCARKGETDRCVEMIQVSWGGDVGGNGETGSGWWERALLGKGGLRWRAINLHLGDVAKKARVWRRWQERIDEETAAERGNWALPDPENRGRQGLVPGWGGDTSQRDHQTLTKERNRRLVAEWDEEDAILTQREMEELDWMAGATRRQADNTDAEAEAGLGQEIAEQQAFWINRVRAERHHMYLEDVDLMGRADADAVADAWEKDEEMVEQQVCEVVGRLVGLRVRRAPDEAVARARAAVLGRRVCEWLHILVPDSDLTGRDGQGHVS